MMITKSSPCNQSPGFVY